MGEGGAKFSWAQGCKIPKYGPGHSQSYDIHLFLNRLLAEGYGRITCYIFSGLQYLYNKFTRMKNSWVRGIHKVRVIDGKIR
jgi:hypothetical protein